MRSSRLIRSSRRGHPPLPTRLVAGASILIASFALTEAGLAKKGGAEAPAIDGQANAAGDSSTVVTLRDAIALDPFSDESGPGSKKIDFVRDQLIVRLRPAAGRESHHAVKDGFAAAMPNEPAAAQLDAVLERRKAKHMRRVFKEYEDEHGRQIDTARARIERIRSSRQRKSKRGLPPIPAETPDLENFFFVEMPGLETTEELDVAIAELEANDLVTSVQPNFRHQALAQLLPPVSTVPDDPHVSVDRVTWTQGSFGNDFPDLYGVRNLRVLEAWSLLDENGNGVFDEGEVAPGQGVVVAVIDTGLDLAHPDIAQSIYVNPGEIPGDGIDNDGNSKIDDLNGWDFIENDAVPDDLNGHGTHVAGTIAADYGNAEGIVGIAPHAQILPIKALDQYGIGTSSGLAAAVFYAVATGADITSNSWGGLVFDPLIEAAFDYAEASGVLSIAAAGNSARPYVLMPALYRSVVAVAAVDEGETLAAFSNWGAGLDLCAPGVAVLSLSANDHGNLLAETTGRTVGDRYLWLNGTSMATPHASGVAALMMSMYPEESAAGIRGRLMESAVSIDAQNPGRESGLGSGRVDALAGATAVAVPVVRPVSIRAGSVAAGAVATVDVELRNFWASATGVSASISTSDPLISVVTGEHEYGDLATGAFVSRRFEVAVAPEARFGDEFELALSIRVDGVETQDSSFTIRGSYFENRSDLAELRPFPLVVSGATFGDFDGDALQDMGVGTAFARTQLYRQRPDGSFENSEPNGSEFLRFPIFADMNGDGLLDMLAMGPSILYSAVLAINVGDGQFEVLPESSGFKFPPYSQITGVTPIDIDADGDLDVVAGLRSLFVDEQGVFRNIVVLRNNGDLTFSDAYASTQIGRLMGSHQLLSLDWNGDGLQDLLGLHRYPNRVMLHRNLGGGRFEDVTEIAFPDDLLYCPGWSQGDCDFFETVAPGDYDNDGDTDLLLTTAGNIADPDRPANMLLENDGTGVYSDATEGSGDLATITMLSGRWGTSFIDLENDGDLDIVIPINIILAGTPAHPPEAKIVLMRNDGGGRFTHVSDVALPPDTPVATLVLAVGDYDRDGSQDILAPVGSLIGEVGGLMHNQAGEGSAWLEIQLREAQSAPDGYGTRVTLVMQDRQHTREVLYSPVEPWRVHFGLGDAEVIDLIETRWSSGVVGLQRNVDVGQRLVLDEAVPCPDLAGGQCPTVEIDVDPESDEDVVNLRSNGQIVVAILGSEAFDVRDIDVSRTFFGPWRTTATHKNGGHIEDVNGDGWPDFSSHYRIPETGIAGGDLQVCLRGQLLDRTPFTGCSAITTKHGQDDGDDGGTIPVPEPSVSLSLLLGGGCLAALARRRERRAESSAGRRGSSMHS